MAPGSRGGRGPVRPDAHGARGTEVGLLTHPEIGILEWFHLGERDHVEQVLEDLDALGVDHLRTGVSWADWHAPGGQEWYDWLIPRLAEQVELLPCFHYTPPSLGVEPRTSAPPRDPKALADFLDVVMRRHGDHFDTVELWNEPNNRAEWDWTLDPEWETFSKMIIFAANWARENGKEVVLGGLSPIDPNWLEIMFAWDVMRHIDVVGVHGFPGTWEPYWDGWNHQLARVREVIDRHDHDADVWVTETGYSTWDRDERAQVENFLNVLGLDVDRVYWYAARDLDPKHASHVGYHSDEREYHFGLRDAHLRTKLLHRLWTGQGPRGVQRYAWLTKPPQVGEGMVLVTGGAGFVGSNLADRLASQDRDVLVLDDLSRPTAVLNAQWLRERHGDRVQFDVSDIRDLDALDRATEVAEAVFHCAGQVAVTTSLEDPQEDFGINAEGTLNLLRALRRLEDPPPMVFTSTNKVYGRMPGLEVEAQGDRFVPTDPEVREHGISEDRPLRFDTPYGCSKGAADQYVLDHADAYDLPATSFRMSCIYGPRQFGTEDQGWIAHFLISTLKERGITIFGTGQQVRDALYVQDLVDAMLLAVDHMDTCKGQAFNIGGGPDRSVSLLEVLDLIEGHHGRRPQTTFEDWRQGDQPYYVSDTRTFRDATGWQPRVGVEQGLKELYGWLNKTLDLPNEATTQTNREPAVKGVGGG